MPIRQKKHQTQICPIAACSLYSLNTLTSGCNNIPPTPHCAIEICIDKDGSLSITTTSGFAGGTSNARSQSRATWPESTTSHSETIDGIEYLRTTCEGSGFRLEIVVRENNDELLAECSSNFGFEFMIYSDEHPQGRQVPYKPGSYTIRTDRHQCDRNLDENLVELPPRS